MYFLVELAEKYLNILSRMLLFHLSTTQDFSSFSVEYYSTSFLTSLSKNSLPLSTHTFPCFRPLLARIFAKPSAVDFPVLSFNGTIQLNLEKVSKTVSKYLKPALSFAKACISTKSACQISSVPLTTTLLFGKRLTTGLCSSSAG